MNKNTALTFFSIIIFIFFVLAYNSISKNFSIPTLNLVETESEDFVIKPVSQEKQNKVINKLKELEKKGLLINFPNKSEKITYEEIGLSFNYNKVKSYFIQCLETNEGCKDEYKEIIKTVDDEITEIDENKFASYMNNLAKRLDSLIISPQISLLDNTVKGNDPNSQMIIKREEVKDQLLSSKILEEQNINISTLTISSNLDIQKAETEKLVERALNPSLPIKYGRQPLYIPAHIQQEFIEVKKENTGYVGKVNKDKISEYLDQAKDNYGLQTQINKERSVNLIAQALLFRAIGESPEAAVILPIVGTPKTNGSVAEKYLEINKSQQRMYKFEDGRLVDTYIVGTGLLAETPSGEFRVLRKEGTAISYWGGWYMPYYMPIGTIDGKFFGFHEIPYQKNSSGQIISRDPNTMGSPATSGCIQLYNKDAIELYHWADIGTKVLIYD